MPAFLGAPPTLAHYFAHYCNEHKDVLFLVDGDTRLTFGDVYAAAVCVAEGLATRHGVAKGDRVGIAARRSHAGLEVEALGAALDVVKARNPLDHPVGDRGRQQELALALVVGERELDAAVAEFADKIAGYSPAILKLGRQAFYQTQDMGFEQALYTLQSQLTINTMAEDAAEGIGAFFGGREPEWKGR